MMNIWRIHTSLHKRFIEMFVMEEELEPKFNTLNEVLLQKIYMLSDVIQIPIQKIILR